jgi:succinate dehydrogenase hydrophobic anchor subunit
MNKLSIQFKCILSLLVLLAASFCLWIHICVVGSEYVQHMQSEWRVINFNVSLNILANGVGVLVVFGTGAAFY